jgi:hypothetical protein
MADEPSFPDPSEAKRKPSADAAPEPPARRIVVTRAEAPADEAPAKLTKEEMQALLAVEGTNRPRPATAVWKRGRILLVPIVLIDLAAHAFLGGAAPFVSAAVTLAALLWTARPLFRRDGWS